MAAAPKSTAAFDELVDLLVDIRDRYVLAPERFTEDLDVVEGFRYVAQLLSEASELLAEADPERPRFSSIVSPARKFLGDNPDALYQQAVIRGDRSYRITGRRDEQTYISFTIHGPDPNGGINGPILADRNDRDFSIAPDGSYELILSPDEHRGNWIKLEPDARFVIVRNYYLRDRSVQTDPDVSVCLDIEPLDDPGPAPQLDDATFASRLRDANAFLHATTLGLRVFGQPATVPFVSNEANTVGTPWSFRNADVDAAGAVDIYYSSGNFDLGPDDALVMDGVLPRCAFANVVLWNVHMQTLEYRSRRASLNSEQIETGEGDSYRIVVSPRDPGVANWLDTGGHRFGTIFWRFLLPEEQPETPRCRVVPVDAIA
ncbi:MAG TPA: DUF1214 domain-containing protein [Acidimicrobiia bacterium]|jgi:hypothetical protein